MAGLKDAKQELPHQGPRSVAFYTLGCKVNHYDTDAMAAQFRQHGYRVVDFQEQADVYVINTCTVTHQAEAKSRKMIRRARRRSDDALVVATGCYPTTTPGRALGLEGVNIVLGNGEKPEIVQQVEAAWQAEEAVCQVENIFSDRSFPVQHIEDAGGRTRANVKIQDGCQEFCAFCIIPFARGRERSRDPQHILEEVQRLVEHGFKEVVLTGIHLSAYGRDRQEDWSLPGVLEVLQPVEGLERIRLSSLEPMALSPEVISLMARYPKLCRHLHLPLQSGSDRVLERMERNYTTGFYRQLVERARQEIPGVAITTDVMVGFPGEDEAAFEESYRFCQEMAFADMHVFPYSVRSGTKAARYQDLIDPQVQNERKQRLLALAGEMAQAFRAQYTGQVVEVLVEDGGSAGRLDGVTDNYVRVQFEGPQQLRGKLVKVRVTGHADGDRLQGSLLAEPVPSLGG